MGRKKSEAPKTVLICSAADVYKRLEDLKIGGLQSHLREQLIEIFDSSDGLHQVAAVKQIGKSLRDIKDPTSRLCWQLVADVLAKIHVAANIGHPVKRAAFRVLEEHAADPETLGAMRLALLEVLNQRDPHLEQLVHGVENVLILLSASLGLRVVEHCFEEVLDHLRVLLVTGVGIISNTEDTQVIGDCYQLLAKVAKAVGLVVQLGAGRQELLKWAQDIFPLLLELLKSDSSILTCKLSTGTVLPLVLKVMNVGDFQKMFHPWPVGWFAESPLAEVCFLSGLVGSLTTEEVLRGCEEEGTVLVDVLLDRTLCVHRRSGEPAFLLTCVKTVLQLVNRILQMLRSGSQFETMKTVLVERSRVTDPLLEFVWSYWEHYIDAVSQHARLVFKGVVSMNVLLSGDATEAELFLTEMALFLMDLPWHRKGKYDTLGYIAELMGCERLLKLRPQLVSGLLSAAEEPAMCSYVKDLVHKLGLLHKSEVSAAEFERAWLDPFLESTREPFRHLSVPLFQHVLPALITIHPGTTQFVFGKLSEGGGDFVPAILKCLLLDRPLIEAGDLERWRNVIDQGMCHKNVQIRLDTLQLLVEHPKSCEPPKPFCLDALRGFLRLNMAVQLPAFRQQMLASLKKLVNRIYDSNTLLRRQLRKGDPSKPNPLGLELFEAHQEFISWLLRTAVDQLYPGANFCRRSTAVEILCLLATTQCTKGAGSQLFLPWTRECLTTLLQCLKDPYETNKSAVLQVLHSVPVELHEFHDELPFAEFLSAAVELTRSARPPDSVTAAYLLTFLSGFKVAGPVVRKLSWLQTWESAPQTLFSSLRIPLAPGMSSETSEALQETSSSALSGRTSRTPFESRYLHLFVDAAFRKDCGDDGLLWMAILLLSELESQLEVARGNLLEASSSGPLYGVMISLRTLLRKVSWRNLPTSDVKTWKTLLDCSVSLAFGVAEVVSPVVTNASPEGQLDVQGDPGMLERMQAALQKGLGRRFDVVQGAHREGGTGVTEIDAVKSTAVAAQMLLLCGWRAHREVSLLFGELCEACPFGDASDDSKRCLLSVDQVLKIGSFFMEQMSSIRHRGAFEQAYTAFQKLCQMLWRCNHPELAKLPMTWLKDVVTVVREGGVSSTRRSAGIPYIVQAVLVSEPQVLGSAAFQQYMAEFLKLADQDTSAVEPKVHAINVLRALFREARLGDVVMPYVADGVRVAVLGFEANVWAVRNAATLLFSTLMTRIFGVNRSRDEPQRRNCLTAHVFFLRFPSLFHFLLDQLNRAGNHLHHRVLGSSRFPVLLLLSRLFPSVVEGGFRLDAFVPHVVRCSRSPSWKVRALAARAVVPLVAPAERREFLLGAILSLPGAACPPENNAVHGTLLQVLQIVNHSRDFFAEQDFVDSVCCRLEEKVWLASGCNPCLATRAAYLSVILACSRSLPEKFALSRSIASKLIRAVLPDITPTQQRTAATCEEFFTATAHEVLLELGLQHPLLFSPEATSYFQFLLCALSSRSQEARFVTLQFVKRATAERVCDACVRCEPKLSRTDIWRSFSTLIVETVQKGPGRKQENASSYSEACAVLASFKQLDYALLCWRGCPTLGSVLEFLLDQMDTLTLEHTKQSLLDLSCNIAEQMTHSHTMDDVNRLSEKMAVQRWTLELLNCSEPTQDLALRVTASRGLGLLVKTVVSESKHGGVAVSFWKALVNFLQDDEVVVRDNAVSVVYNLLAALGDPEFPPSLFSRRTPLDVALRLFVRLGNVEVVVPCLVDWMLTCQDVCHEAESDEQPFEKGELNTYAEEVTLTELCSGLLKVAATQVVPGTTFARQDFSYLPPDLKNSASASGVTLEDIYRCCVQQSSSQANEVFSSKTALLLNRHMDPPLIRVYQHVCVAVALKDCVDRVVVAEVSSLASGVPAVLKPWLGLTTFLAKIVEKL
ncbi:unnamed protein product [Ixodes persulcatus]